MKDKLKTLFLKYKSIIAYVFFGGCTTLVNTAVYYLCYNLLGISNVVATVIAWLLAVLFAFITNKLWVFESKSFSAQVLRRELPSFFAARLLTGLLDLLIMYIAVDRLQLNALLWKLLSNVIVIILNYIASKLFVFKER